ncbi:hypothetical protein YWY31_01050 [Paenibacillus illinoisensis]
MTIKEVIRSPFFSYSSFVKRVNRNTETKSIAFLQAAPLNSRHIGLTPMYPLKENLFLQLIQLT